MDEFKDIPHHDSGYFPGLPKGLARIALFAFALIAACAWAAIWFIRRA